MSLIRSLLANQLQDNPNSTMDVMGNYFGADTRQQPTQANVKPQTTTIDYNQDGSVDVSQNKTINQNGQEHQVEINQSLPAQQTQQAPQYQVPQLEAPINPQQDAQANQQILQAQMRQQQPQQMQPVAPVQPQMQATQQPVFNRMVQAESGGQQYNPQGGVLTSPKGAQGIAQIMPATAANPGYGIAPATPEEIATKEGNLAFGQRYHQGMLQQFGGDQEKAAAAYNAGPGRVQQAVAQADQQGGTWKDYLPAETRTYLTDVFSKNQELAKRVQPMIAGMTSSDVGLTPTEQAIHQIALNSGDVNAVGMGAYAGGNAIDPATRRAYADQHATLLEQQKLEAKAQRDLQTYLTDPTGRGGLKLANDLKKEGEEGSYLKAYLFQRLGLHDLAKNEQQKLGAGDQWTQTMVAGKPAWVKFNGQGAPIKGYTAEGELTPNELIKTTGNLSKAEMESGLYFNPLQPNSPKYALRKINGRSEFVNTATQEVETRPEVINTLTKMSVAGSLPMQQEAAFGKAGATAQGKAAGEGFTPGQMPARPGSPYTPGAQGPAVPQPMPSAPAILQAQQGGVVSPQGQPAIPQVQQPQIQQPAPQGYQSPTGAAPVWQQRQQAERGGVRGQTVDKVIDTEYREEARAGDIVSNTRKQQFAIFDRPGINSDRLFGLYNSASENPTDQKYSIVRDIIGGQFKPEAEVSQRLAQLDLTPQEKSALMEYNVSNQRINAASLKQNSGPGSISDSEQRANKEANVDITKVPALGAYNAMAQSQFTGDMARAKMDWAAGQTFANAAQMDKAWRKEQAGLTTMYADMAKQRAEWIAANGATTSAVKEGYKRFPIPEYDPNSESWKKTKPLNEIFGNKATR
jgi:hypothetical protein